MPGMTSTGYTPPKEEKPKKTPKKKKTRKKGPGGLTIFAIVFFLAAVLACGATFYIYTQTAPFEETFCPNVSLSGYPLAGASYRDAEGILDGMTKDAISAWRYELLWQGSSYVLTGEDVGLAVDAQATLDPLWTAGRSGGMLSRFWAIQKLKNEPVVGTPVYTFDLSGADALLERLKADVDCEAVDATVEYVPGSATPFRFTEEATGYELDLAPLREAIERSILAMSPGRTEVSPKETEPAVYEAVLRDSLTLRARLRFTLEKDTASASNAILAAKKLNALRIEAGENVSFNEVVGARTEAAGYVLAEELAFGEGVSGVGGGVCQTATALYQAALLSGLEVTERHAAARPVRYATAGQEAAVSGQGLDLVIRNTTNSPVFLLTRVYETDDKTTILEIQFIGEELSNKYALESDVEETVLIEEPVYVRDSEGTYAKYTDERIPVGEAKPGYRAETRRVVIGENGSRIESEVISEDVYDAIPPTVYVGVNKR